MKRQIILATCLLAGAAASDAQFEMTDVSGPGRTPLLLTKAGWTWEDLSPTVPAVTYNVFRRVPGDGFRCVQSNLLVSAWSGDPDEPPPGEAWWYTVNGDDTWSENRHGSDVAVTERCLCSGATPAPATDISSELVGFFAEPMHLAATRTDRTRAYLALRAGTIEVIDLRDGSSSLFLDISSEVRTCGEQGLLSLAFHPDFADNHRLFVYLNAAGGAFGEGVARVVEYTAFDADSADPASARLIFETDRPSCFHNGGQIAFGPHDDYLYIALGDGDVPDRAQDLTSDLGKVLRIDVDSSQPYAIPPDNPFVGSPGAVAEIWALGLRNPWRMSFDRATGDLYIGDVGDSCVEEVSVGLAAAGGGENYGWTLLEGSRCVDSPSCIAPCSSCAAVADCSALTMPVVDYDRIDVPGSCTVIGGHVYRGCALPALAGRYFYSDWCASTIRSFELQGSAATDPRQWSLAAISSPVSFGEDARGEIYVLTQGGGVYRLIGD